MVSRYLDVVQSARPSANENHINFPVAVPQETTFTIAHSARCGPCYIFLRCTVAVRIVDILARQELGFLTFLISGALFSI